VARKVLQFRNSDLSAYNILYWAGEVTLIDFPQVTHSQSNSHAQMILERDLQRVCEYFAEQGANHDHQRIARQLWQHYAAKGTRDTLAEISRFEVAEED
jgi:RIO kinase 1